MSGSLLAGIVISDGGSSSSGGASTIEELYTDPASPMPEEVWMLATGSGAIADGTPIGMLLALTYTGNAGSAFTYQLSYHTLEGNTIRVAMA